jgi:hypothetical protein
VHQYPHICDVKLETFSFLLTFEKVEVDANSDNIKGVILDVMGKYGLASAILTWLPNGFVLNVMLILCFKAFSLG